MCRSTALAEGLDLFAAFASVCFPPPATVTSGSTSPAHCRWSDHDERCGAVSLERLFTWSWRRCRTGRLPTARQSRSGQGAQTPQRALTARCKRSQETGQGVLSGRDNDAWRSLPEGHPWPGCARTVRRSARRSPKPVCDCGRSVSLRVTDSTGIGPASGVGGRSGRRHHGDSTRHSTSTSCWRRNGLGRVSTKPAPRYSATWRCQQIVLVRALF